MCKYFYDTAQVYPYSLYDSVLAVEGHSRIHTWLFISSIEVLGSSSFLERNVLVLIL